MKKPQSKWFYAFAGVALALVCAIVAIVVICVTTNNTPGQTTPNAPEIPADGPETGIYYYDVAGSEILLSLNSGNKFTIAGTDINKSGDYTVNGEDIALDFVRDEDGTASAKYNGDTIVLTYKDATMTFLKKVYYTVSFDTDGGNAIEAISVLNGKTVAEPTTPEKNNCVFLGWYTDAQLTTPFTFNSEAVKSDITLYARWAEKIAGIKNFEATLDLNYEGAPAATKITSVSGKLYDVPTPERENYTFEGWFISVYEDSSRLSFAYSGDYILTADTTLFAVWSDDNSTKLKAPAVSVYENSIKWNSVVGASRYEITIAYPDGKVETVSEGGTSYSFDFGSADPGEFVIAVTAIAANAENNSEAAVRCYVNKSLPKINSFQVIDNILIFNEVAGAEKYCVTIDCGNDAHNHTYFDNGMSTCFNFANCPMQNGGIIFTVVASANGYADSVPATFVYDRTLSEVSGITYVPETDSFVWDAVEFAAGYTVTVTVDGNSHTFNVGNKTSFSTAVYTGDIKIAVTPVTSGYNSPKASEAACTKTIPAAPAEITVSGNVISWSAIEGATYEIKMNGKTFTADTNSFDLSNSGLTTNLVYKVSVKAVKDGLSSSYSEEVSVAYLVMDPVLVYSGNTVYWSPVVGATNFEVRVNGAPAKTFSGVTSARVTLTKAGSNVIEVRYTDNGGSEWASITVNAFEIIYMSRSMSGDKTEYVAIGDTLTPPDNFTNDGYYFSGWYNTPATSSGNGVKYEDFTFLGNEATVLYADWTPNTYNVELNVEGFGITNIDIGETADATYTRDFTLPVPESENATYNVFIGWYTGPSGSGVRLTDEKGNSVAPFPYTHDIVAHPYYNANILSFELREDNTYAVSAGVNFDSVSHVYIPSTYNNLPVTVIVENAFKSRTSLVTIDIPNTIKIIGVGAFTSTGSLKAINVYEVEGNHVPNYSSYDGALIRHDMGTTYLEAFPRAKTGTYVMPDGVDVIRNKAFQYANISKVVISKDVSLIQDSAFYACSKLTSIEFANGKTSDVTLSTKMFDRTTGITSIKFPAGISNIDITILQNQKNLTSIEVEQGGRFYSSVNGMLTNSIGDTIIYAPNTVSGIYTIPDAINYIGENAFNGRNGITELIIPTNVLQIGNNAFSNCLNLKKITFVGKRVEDIYVGNSAFAGCKLLTEITFGGTGSETEINKGAISFGSNVFTPYKATNSSVYEPSIQKVTFENGTNIRALGDYTFADQTTLISLSFGKNIIIENIGSYAFKDVTSLKTIEIPSSTKVIGDGAFQGCTKATSVKFAEGGNEISFGENVFANCTSITKIELPASTKSFNGSAFAGCSNLSEVIVSDSNPYLMAKNGILYGIDSSRNPVSLIFFPKTINADPATINALPWNTITKIGDSVFEGVTTLTEFKISSKITEIGAGAFSGCTALKTVTSESGAADFTLGAKAFYGCSSLTSVSLPASTSVIGTSAFENCSSLSTFTIPSAVTSINDKAFRATALTSVNIPSNMTSIGAAAFQNSQKLTTVSFESGSELTLGNEVFSYCSVLNNVDFNGRVKIIPEKAFFSSAGISNVDISGATTIGKSAFSCCSGLVSIDIPNTVTLIDNSAFESSTKLTTVNFLPGGSEPLDFGMLVFKGASAMEEFTFPKRTGKIYDFGFYSNNSVTSNGQEDSSQKFQIKNFFLMFSGASKLKNIFVEDGCTTLKSIDGILYETNKDGVPFVLLYCPVLNEGVEGIDGARTAVIPNTVTMVENHAFYGVSKITAVVFEDLPVDHISYGKPVLSIGNGTAEDIGNGSEVFKSSSIKSVTLPDHLGLIGHRAFSISTPKLTVTFSSNATKVSIGNCAFYNCSGISSLTLYGIDYLASSAFSWANGLTSLTFKNSTFETINPGTFNKTAISSLVIPASVKTIRQGAFSNATALKNISFEEGSNLLKLESYLFQTQNSNATLTNPKKFDLTNATKLNTIEAYAFKCCTGLTSFTIPESVTSMGEHVFAKCTGITSLTLNSGCTADMLFKNNHEGYVSLLSDLTSLTTLSMNGNGKQLTVEDGVLYDKAKTVVYSFPAKKDPTGYTLPTTVTIIEAGAFTGFTGKTFVFHEGIEVIGEKAFQNSAIENIVLPASITTIDKNAFSGCKATALSFAEGCKLTVIPEKAFYQMSSLQTLTLPDNIKIIEAEAFQNCNNLRSLILPAALEEIGDNAFENALFLTDLVFQQNVKTIGTRAFATAIRLKSLTIPASIEYIGDGAFESFGNFEGEAATVTFEKKSNLKYIGSKAFYNLQNTVSIEIPEGVTTIGDNAFENMPKLEEITIPESVTSIGAGAFKRNSSLRSVTLPAGITEIAANLFYGNKNLETVNIPEGVTAIGESAFAFTAVKTVVIPKNVVSIGNNAFESCASLTDVEFDSENKLTELGDNMFKNTTSLVNVTLPKDVEVLGNNIFENSSVKNIVLPSSLKTIGDYAFANCDNVEAFEIYGNVSSIGAYAFYDCDKLAVTALSFGVETIGDFAFRSCDLLNDAYIPATVSTLGANPFFECPLVTAITVDKDNTVFKVDSNGAILDADNRVLYYYPASATAEEVVLPATLNEIKMGAFINNPYIKSLYIPRNVSAINDFTFMNCVNLETVTIEDGSILKTIGNHAFDGCEKLTTLTLPNTLTSIGEYAFYNCKTLDNIAIPSSATSLGNYAFANCSSLSNVSFEGASLIRPFVIGTHFFENCSSLTSVVLPNYFYITVEDAEAHGLGNTRSNVIPSYMFAGTGIVEAVIPSTVTRLDTSGVFMNCKELTTVNFGTQTYSYNKLGDHLFDGCEKLSIVILPKGGTTTLGNYAFANCTSLLAVRLYYNTEPTEGGEYMFYNCTKLQQIIWEKTENNAIYDYTKGTRNMKYIAPYFFAGCTSLSTFQVASGATISNNAFDGCTALSNLKIDGTQVIAAIGDEAFKGCTGFKTFNVKFAIPSKVGARIFEGWTSGQTINFTQDLKTNITNLMNNGIFSGCEASVFDKNGEKIELN